MDLVVKIDAIDIFVDEQRIIIKVHLHSQIQANVSRCKSIESHLLPAAYKLRYRDPSGLASSSDS